MKERPVLTRLLCFRSSPRISNALALGFAFVASYVMGFGALRELIALRVPAAAYHTIPVEPASNEYVLQISAVVAILSVLAVAFGLRSRSRAGVFWQTYLAIVTAAASCTPIIYAITTSDPIDPIVLVSVTLIGLTFSLPLGGVYGMVFATSNAFLVQLRERAPLSSLDAGLVVVGVGAIVCALVTSGTALLFVSPANPDLHTWTHRLCLGLGTAGAISTAAGVTWLAGRLFALFQAAKGRLANVVVLQTGAGEVDVNVSWEESKTLFPLGPARSVLARVVDEDGGPFRRTERRIPIASVPTPAPLGVDWRLLTHLSERLKSASSDR